MKRRAKVLLSMFFIIMTMLVCRLYYIQIVCGGTLSAAADGQQMVPVIYPYSRGIIYDRNMNPLTNTSKQYYYLVAPEDCTTEFESLIELIGGERTGEKGDNYIVYGVDTFQQTINALLAEQHHAYGFCVSRRYEDNQTAAHLIGYIRESDGRGASGLEKMYEQQLSSKAPTQYLSGDGVGNILGGFGLNTYETEAVLPAGLVTTISQSLQTEAEHCLSAHQVSGAVLIAEVNSGQIFAMASSPRYNPNELELHLRHDSSELVNKAVQCQYPAGPVKGVVKQAAVRAKVAFLEAAKGLGLGQCVWENFPDESSGSLQPMNVTPVQVCQMMVTLANDGKKIPLSVVKSQVKETPVSCLSFVPGETFADQRIIGDGWAAGVCGSYVVVVYVEEKEKSARHIFEELENVLQG